MEGTSYLYFILPGVVGLSSMRSSYSALSMRVSVARLHEKSFENYLTAPIRMSRLTLGYILSGAFRGLYTAVIMSVVMLIFGGRIYDTPAFVLALVLNCLVFSGLGFIAAMMIDTHYDLNRFTTFVITPMSFLCGTFFSLSQMPILIKHFIELLPLTHAVRLLRDAAYGRGIQWFSVIVLLFYLVFIAILSIRLSYEESAV